MTVPFLDLQSARRELGEELAAAVGRVVDSGRYILGPEVEAFESEFAAYCGARRAVGVGNGLDALTLILRALDIGAGDEVIVPAHTFIATWLAVTRVGARPVPVEPDPETMNLDPQQLAGRITERTRALVPVHLYGQPADMEPILETARRAGLKVIEDAAQSHGARYRGRRAGSLADAAAFSFYPAKNLGALGDGGAVVTDDDALADRVARLRNYGSERKYAFEEPGVNSRLDALQAAALRVKLEHLDEWNERRRAAAVHYLEALAGLPGLTLPRVPEWAEPVWHLFVVRVADRDAVAERLAAEGVETLIHYPEPPHRSAAYRGSGLDFGELPITEELGRTVLSLPMGPHLEPDARRRVADALRRILA